jgi:hypothetical protein
MRGACWVEPKTLHGSNFCAGRIAMATSRMKKQIAVVGVPDVPEFLEQIIDSGGHLWRAG